MYIQHLIQIFCPSPVMSDKFPFLLVNHNFCFSFLNGSYFVFETYTMKSTIPCDSVLGVS